jgi:hypothetical protein
VKDLMDEQPREELASTLRTLNKLSVTYSFETALRALEEGIRIHKTDFHAAAVLAAPLCVKIVFATRRAKLYEVFTGI